MPASPLSMTSLGGVGVDGRIAAGSAVPDGCPSCSSVAGSKLPSGVTSETGKHAGPAPIAWAQMLRFLGIAQARSGAASAPSAAQHDALPKELLNARHDPGLEAAQLIATNSSAVPEPSSKGSPGHVHRRSEGKRQEAVPSVLQATTAAPIVYVSAANLVPDEARTEPSSGDDRRGSELRPTADSRQSDPWLKTGSVLDVQTRLNTSIVNSAQRADVGVPGNLPAESETSSPSGQQRDDPTPESAPFFYAESSRSLEQRRNPTSNSDGEHLDALAAPVSPGAGPVATVQRNSHWIRSIPVAGPGTFNDPPNSPSQPVKSARAEVPIAESLHQGLQDKPLRGLGRAIPVNGQADTAPVWNSALSVQYGGRHEQQRSEANGDSEPGTRAPTEQNPLATLDAQPGRIPVAWTHADSRSVAAGFRDPALGWVSVEARADATGLHATLIPASPEAAHALTAHMTGLATHLTERGGSVDSLTVAVSGDSSAEMAMRHDGQSEPQQQFDAREPQGTPRADKAASQKIPVARIGDEVNTVEPRLPPGSTISLVA